MNDDFVGYIKDNVILKKSSNDINKGIYDEISIRGKGASLKKIDL